MFCCVNRSSSAVEHWTRNAYAMLSVGVVGVKNNAQLVANPATVIVDCALVLAAKTAGVNWTI